MWIDLIKQIEQETGLQVKLFYTKEIEPCIIYEVSPLSNNGILAQDSLQLRIVHNTAKDCLEVEKILNKIVLTKGDRVIPNYSSARLYGGGFMPQDETNTVHKYNFYLIKRKAEIQWL